MAGQDQDPPRAAVDGRAGSRALRLLSGRHAGPDARRAAGPACHRLPPRAGRRLILRRWRPTSARAPERARPRRPAGLRLDDLPEAWLCTRGHHEQRRADAAPACLVAAFEALADGRMSRWDRAQMAAITSSDSTRPAPRLLREVREHAQRAARYPGPGSRRGSARPAFGALVRHRRSGRPGPAGGGAEDGRASRSRPAPGLSWPAASASVSRWKPSPSSSPP